MDNGKTMLAVTLGSIAVLSIALIGCKGKNQFNSEDFSKITKGMTEEEVKDLLREPTEIMEAPGFKCLFWHVGDKYYSISFVDGKVEEPLGPTSKEEYDSMKALMILAKDYPKSTENHDRKGTDLSSERPIEPATTSDGRWIISVSGTWLTVKGVSFEIGKISRTELEKFLGPPDHVGKAMANSQFLFWDKQGLRAEYSTRHGKVVNLSCFLVIDADQDDSDPLLRQPKKAFDGLFKVEGVEVSKNNTRQLLEKSARIKLLIRKSKLLGPAGFIIQLPNQEVHFDVDEHSRILTEVTVSSTTVFLFGKA